ncbi:glycosyltransferase family 4 protein [Aeromicrobium erythreum]|jgi:glycosyltransferase involved in cell wall biosynthesis|uniref:Glycosyl transferase family 1 n=1 Tax=Aeromicrobium erythreum TaxID=2041 RepID=A0A0U4CI55_9ACTN|nr:glycosyltransferase family 4 protein [Aeromicrobium erythreum]ALX05077.1 glycosyl transferase family 1 [Aeromicrobium erythreum]
MRVLVHDYSGHPFQAQLSRELARRGHDVTHSTCNAYVSGKGRLEAQPGETIRFETVGDGIVFDKSRFVQRLLLEVRLGVELVRHVRRVRPDVALMSNVQIPTLVVFAAAMALFRQPWVLWHQDVYSVAVRSFAGAKLSRSFRAVALAFDLAERWTSRRASQVVVIADSFVPVHERWGTAHKTTVIANWAPLDEIVPVQRKNDWAVEHELDDVQTLLYSGTLGLKHDPALLVRLTAAVRELGRPVRLVVVNEGPAADVIRAEADRLDVPLTLLPFQPYERLPEVLGSGDVLVVLLDQQAGAFSVPSKTLSYLCAGRPVVGLMPEENAASDLVERAGGHVGRPEATSLPAAAAWVDALLADDERRDTVRAQARELAEQEFSLAGCADRFEAVLERGAR